MSTPTRDSAPPRQRAPESVSPARGPIARASERRPRSAPGGARAASPALGRRELAGAIAAGVALAVITTWPLLLHLQSRISPDLGDPVRTAWQIAWVGHAMLHDPLHLFDSNAFYPHPLSLAFSDSLLGYGPAAFFGSGTLAALLRYNLIFLLTWSLCFVGAYLLARELGLGRIGAAVAGVAFAYAPYRATEAGHFQVISSGGIPLALFLLLRGYRRRSRGLVLAGWLVSAWQLSLGWTLGLQYGYLLAVLAVLLAWRWWRSARVAGAAPALAPTRGLLGVTCIGVAACLAVAVYQGIPYLEVAHDYGTAKRTLAEVKKYSAGPAALLAAPAQNPVWASVTAPLRKHVREPDESVFFPGLVILVLALLGFAAPRGSPYTRRLRLALGGGALVCALLALGFGLGGAGYPYRLLYSYAPGWDGVRVPGRIFTLTTLGLALLAGAGAHSLTAWVRALAERRARLARRAGPVLLAGLTAALLLAAMLAEGARNLPQHVVPQPARAEIGLPAPVLDLPTDGPADRLWQYFSTDGLYKIPVGDSTFDIPAVDDLRGGMSGFPDRASVEKLRWYGVRTVVLHTYMPKLPGVSSAGGPEPADPASAAAKPIAGLGITRKRVGSLVIYELGSGPKALHATN
jgi:hypothetical protein